MQLYKHNIVGLQELKKYIRAYLIIYSTAHILYTIYILIDFYFLMNRFQFVSLKLNYELNDLKLLQNKALVCSQLHK